MPARRLHHDPGRLAGHHPCAEPLEARDLRIDRVGLDVEMRPRIMVDALDDDLDVFRRRHQLDEAAVDVDVLGQGIAERRAPEPRFGEEIAGAAVDHDVAQSAAMHGSASGEESMLAHFALSAQQGSTETLRKECLTPSPLRAPRICVQVPTLKCGSLR